MLKSIGSQLNDKYELKTTHYIPELVLTCKNQREESRRNLDTHTLHICSLGSCPDTRSSTLAITGLENRHPLRQ